MHVRIHPSWEAALKGEFEKPYFQELATFVRREYAHGGVFPPPKELFRAFDECPFESVRVVILGQDPYHGRGQANGLCFSVHEGVRTPPSLRNIFQEIDADLGRKERSPDLSVWATQGVLLLNATLTVREGKAGSHQGRGWELFTDAVVRLLNEQTHHTVFLLWGNYARAKGAHINRTTHCVLEAAHPSPFSANQGFFGCKHFSKANRYLAQHGKVPIAW